LAREFTWAQRLLDQSVAVVKSMGARVRRLFGRRPVVPAALPLPLSP
jgi:hypothetical protein